MSHHGGVAGLGGTLLRCLISGALRAAALADLGEVEFQVRVHGGEQSSDSAKESYAKPLGTGGAREGGMKKTIIFGRMPKVLALAVQHKADKQTIRYGDGQVVESSVVFFQGGYDDYDGSMAWAEVPAEIPGTPQRFSPAPGQWMSGVRV